jgi:hypothetical protein
MRTLTSRLAKFLVLLVSAMLLTSCYRITYRIADRSGAIESDERTLNYFLFGLVPTRENLDAGTLCPSSQRLLKVKTSQKPENVFHALLGGYLTSSFSVDSVCLASGPEASK